MRVKLKPEKTFEVAGRAGRLEHLRQVGDEWNGMIELQGAQGGKLILRRAEGLLVHALQAIDGITDWVVISGSPDLLRELGSPYGDQAPG